ncbi:MIZ1 [Mytilus edulis]|uniref:ZBTB17 n=1 Tax=Mytilus edulis TaxID=6550 RepID=A0A8S3R6C5_MYTED|nr:MIZ1 [Mytilus edulis]
METVNMYHLRDDGVALIVYKSRCHYDNTMHVNKFDHYLSYISNLVMYTQKYQCGTCDRHFKHLRNMKRHQLKCTGQTVYRFKGGFYSNPKTIFDKLEEHGIRVQDRLYPWFVVYDFEAMLVSMQESNSAKLTWTQRHEPISISVCSNVEGFTERRFFADPDGQSLVQHMVDYMSEISNKALELTRQKFANPFHQLDADIQNPYRALLEDDDEDEYKLDAFLDDTELLERKPKTRRRNSAKYDMNSIKTHLVKTLIMHEPGQKFTVKRNNSYACLANETFKVLDITLYSSQFGILFDITTYRNWRIPLLPAISERKSLSKTHLRLQTTRSKPV